MRIAFIGGGTMAEAMISAFLQKNAAQPSGIAVADVARERLQHLTAVYRVVPAPGNPEVAAMGDIVVLAVKPGQFPAAASELKGKLAPEQTVLSIMAGVTVGRIRDALDHLAVVRAMPNTAAQVGEAVTAWTAAPEVSEEAREQVRTLLRTLGSEAYFDDEKYIDMATAVSGSGIGFVFVLMEAFIDGAVHLGVPRQAATEMVVQTFAGAARLAQETGKSAAELRALVTTPGGTTAEGLLALEAAGVRAAIAEALIAAYEKSRSLGSSPTT
jgi:pyrroline-5-carboxylate reductase